MSKASSPVRLERDLMEAAKATGALFHRSSSEQIEYWADLGRKLSSVLDPSVILALKAGLATLSVEQVKSVEINPDDVFTNLKRKSDDGTLSAAIAGENVRYQASKNHPGMLEKVYPDGSVEAGKFIDGTFNAIADR